MPFRSPPRSTHPSWYRPSDNFQARCPDCRPRLSENLQGNKSNIEIILKSSKATYVLMAKGIERHRPLQADTFLLCSIRRVSSTLCLHKHKHIYLVKTIKRYKHIDVRKQTLYSGVSKRSNTFTQAWAFTFEGGLFNAYSRSDPHFFL